MPRSKFIIVLALLLLLTAPVAAAEAQSPPSFGEGSVVVFDDMASSDGALVSLTGVDSPPEGKEYVAWLAEDEQVGFLNLGTLEVGDDGSVSHTFGSESDGYTGDSLIATYSGWAISIEDAGSSPSMPSGRGAVSDTFSESSLEDIRALSASVSGLKTQLELASVHANLARDSETLDELKMHAQHAISIIEGAEGANYDAGQDPGDGVGALAYAAAAKAAANALSAAAEEDSAMAMYAPLAATSADSAATRAMAARDAALEAIAQGDLGVAGIFIGPGGNTLLSLLNAASNGFDTDGDGMLEVANGEGGANHANRDTQMALALSATPGSLPDLATPTPLPTPTPTATPVPPTPTPTPIAPQAPGLPKVGDQSAPIALQISLLAAAAALLAIGGATAVRRNRGR